MLIVRVLLAIGILGTKDTIFESLKELNYSIPSSNWKFPNALGKEI